MCAPDKGTAEVFQHCAGGKVLGDGKEHIFQVPLAVHGDIHIDMLSVLEDQEFFIENGSAWPGDDDDLLTAIVPDDAGVLTQQEPEDGRLVVLDPRAFCPYQSVLQPHADDDQ